MHLSYAELEDFVAELHRVAPDRRIALKGRLKHFQRLGWPAGTNKGKGARVDYGIGQTMCLAIGMEMLQLGLTPERVVEHLKFSNLFLAQGFAEALREYGPAADEVYFIFSPESLSALRGEGGESRSTKASFMVSVSKLADFINTPLLKNMRRFAMINVSDLLDRYIEYFIDKGLGAPDNLTEHIANWESVARRAIDDWNEHVFEGRPLGDS